MNVKSKLSLKERLARLTRRAPKTPPPAITFITLRVTNPSRQPLTNAKVELLLNEELIAADATDARGVVTFTGDAIAKLVGKVAEITIDGFFAQELEIEEPPLGSIPVGVRVSIVFDLDGAEFSDLREEASDFDDEPEEGPAGRKVKTGAQDNTTAAKPASRTDALFASKRNAGLTIAIIAVVVIVAIALIGNMVGGQGASSAQQEQLVLQQQAQSQRPDVPIDNPVDAKHRGWQGDPQIIAKIIIYLILGLVIWDRVWGNQYWDVVGLLVALLLTVNLSFLEKITRGFLQDYQPSLNSLESRLQIIALVVVAVVFVALLLLAVTGKLDLSILVGYLAFIGGRALITGELGVFQVFFKVKDAPILALTQVNAHLALLNNDHVRLSQLTYVVFAIAIILGFIEVIRITVIAVDNVYKKMWSVVVTVAYLPTYLLVIPLAGSYDIPVVVTFGLVTAIFFGLTWTTLMRGGSSGEIATGQNTVGTPFIAPFDRLILPLVVALEFIAMTGRVF